MGDRLLPGRLRPLLPFPRIPKSTIVPRVAASPQPPDRNGDGRPELLRKDLGGRFALDAGPLPRGFQAARRRSDLSRAAVWSHPKENRPGDRRVDDFRSLYAGGRLLQGASFDLRPSARLSL